MTSEAVKLARSRERIALLETARDILTNPAVTALVGFILVEYLQTHEELVQVPGPNAPVIRKRVPGGIIGEKAGSILEAGLVGYLWAPALAKTLETMPKISDLAKLGALIK